MTYTARYRREEDAWLVDIAEEEGCHTYGRTLQQARERVREALAVWLDVDDAALVIRDEFDLPDEVNAVLVAARAARGAEARTRRHAVDLLAHAAHLLSGLSFTVRDAAAILAVSHQRVQQLLARPDPLKGVLVGDPAQKAPWTLPSADDIVEAVRRWWAEAVRNYLLLDEDARLEFVEQLTANASTPLLLTVANDLSKVVTRRLRSSGVDDEASAAPELEASVMATSGGGGGRGRDRKSAISVEPRSGGRWAVQKDGTQRASKVTHNKSEAVARARQQAKREGTELIIKGKDGRIQHKDSGGNDPRRSKG